MNTNRCRNIFTLGDYQEKLNRRPQIDPFERDPFKVQSYNFRYAERPSFPVATISKPNNNVHDTNKTANGACQTYFYNYGFSNGNTAVNQRKSSVLGTDEQRFFNLANRRKRFLQAALPSTFHLRDISKTLLPKPNTVKLLNVPPKSSQSYTKCCTNLSMQTSKPSCTFTNSENINSRKVIQIKTASSARQSQTRVFKTTSISSPLSDLNKKPKSLGSGCEININIKNLEDNSLQDNVNIKIETDSLYSNYNLNPGSSKNNLYNKNSKLAGFESSETFAKSSKLPSRHSPKRQESQAIVRKMDSERIKELTSIYSSSEVLKRSATKRNVTSTEHIPSRLPLGVVSNNNNYSTLNDNSTSVIRNNLFRSKSLLEKPKMNKSSITNCYLQKSPYNNLSSSTKSLKATKQTSPYSFTNATKNSELKMGVPIRFNTSSSAKLPINVNINVYADKLNLLKV